MKENNTYAKGIKLGLDVNSERVFLYAPRRNDPTKAIGNQRRDVTAEFIWTMCKFMELKGKTFEVVTDTEKVELTYVRRDLMPDEVQTQKEHVEARTRKPHAHDDTAFVPATERYRKRSLFERVRARINRKRAVQRQAAACS